MVGSMWDTSRLMCLGHLCHPEMTRGALERPKNAENGVFLAISGPADSEKFLISLIVLYGCMVQRVPLLRGGD